MTEQQKIKNQLEEQLERVKRRLEILDMIEEKLFQMKELAQKVVDQELTIEEIQEINDQVQNLREDVKLLDSETTQLS